MSILYQKNIDEIALIPKDGEMSLAEYLRDNLDESFYIFFKPNINGDRPSVVILKKGSGIIIIEVKEFNLDEYVYVNGGYAGAYGVIISKDKSEIPLITPFEKVMGYKENLYNYHIEELTKKSLLDANYSNLVKTAVYFHNSTEEEIKLKFSNNTKEMRSIKIWGVDSNIVEDIKSSLIENKLFDDKLYEQCFDRFRVKYHGGEEGKFSILEKKKRNLMRSKKGANIKIKGIAGSGKTVLLANRAVGAVIRKKGKCRILILSYNMTLRNYIKDKIGEVRENFYWNVFDIVHFNMFIKQKAYECGIEIKRNLENIINDETYRLFKEVISKEDKYDAIFIDGVQDFKREWLDLLKDVFLKEDGEYVIFGDEKQNIYNRALDDKKRVITNIKGRWNELTKSYRVSTNIANLLREFQKEFFLNKYELDNIEIEEQIGLAINEDEVRYMYNIKLDYLDVFDISKKFFDSKKINYNDTCIIGGSIDELREMEYYARKKYFIKVERMFETKEEFIYISSLRNSKEKLELLRESRRFNFFTQGEGIKMCTTESFKGWEIDNLVLIIDREDKNTELIYTAITRCKKNLLIINRGNEEFHKFFNKIKNEKILSRFEIMNKVEKNKVDVENLLIIYNN